MLSSFVMGFSVLVKGASHGIPAGRDRKTSDLLLIENYPKMKSLCSLIARQPRLTVLDVSTRVSNTHSVSTA